MHDSDTPWTHFIIIEQWGFTMTSSRIIAPSWNITWLPVFKNSRHWVLWINMNNKQVSSKLNLQYIFSFISNIFYWLASIPNEIKILLSSQIFNNQTLIRWKMRCLEPFYFSNHKTLVIMGFRIFLRITICKILHKPQLIWTMGG